MQITDTVVDPWRQWSVGYIGLFIRCALISYNMSRVSERLSAHVQGNLVTSLLIDFLVQLIQGAKQDALCDKLHNLNIDIFKANIVLLPISCAQHFHLFLLLIWATLIKVTLLECLLSSP